MNPVRRVGDPKATDASVVERVAGGDLDALGTLFDRHEAGVRRFLARLGVGLSDLDDLVQQTFLDVLHAAKGFDGRGEVRPWLFGVAARVASRHRRSFSRMVARVDRWARSVAHRAPHTPAEDLEERETERRFLVALSRLSDKKREAFVLVELEGASGDEAAAALGVPVNTVWTRLHHAREELRKALGEVGG